ncbi:MAG: Lyzozyme M1 (1,4-beta-N-acetylmuramidase) [Lachnospiraceae bacterium]|nr:Lyzozyme M1 (1,4-beta-N-acetylmuramidase) [Lachnospiraceae bacterium]
MQERTEERKEQTEGRHRTPKQKVNKSRGIAAVFFAMLSLLAIAALLFVFFYFRKENEALKQELKEMEAVEAIAVSDEMYTEEEVSQLLAEQAQTLDMEARERFLEELKEQATSGNGTVLMLRHFFPDQIVFADAGQYYFMDINDALQKHPYVNDNLVVTENNEYRYYENEQLVTHKGIDVSSYQGAIDWQQVAADGVEYAIIRLGIRGYGSEGRLVLDEYFVRNIEGATAAGVEVGVYFFTQALTPEEAREEADFVIEALSPYNLQCTVVLDVEDVNASSARTNVLTMEQWTDNCIAFFDRIEEAGYRPMIYGNLKTFMLMLDLTRIEQYPKWFAAYTPYFYFPYAFDIWQYTDTAKVAGITGNVDMNISFYDFSLQ